MRCYRQMTQKSGGHWTKSGRFTENVVRPERRGQILQSQPVSWCVLRSASWRPPTLPLLVGIRHNHWQASSQCARSPREYPLIAHLLGPDIYPPESSECGPNIVLAKYIPSTLQDHHSRWWCGCSRPRDPWLRQRRIWSYRWLLRKPILRRVYTPLATPGGRRTLYDYGQSSVLIIMMMATPASTPCKAKKC